MANRSRRKLTLQTCFIAPLLKLRTSLLFDVIAQVVKREQKFIQRLNQAQLKAGQTSEGSDIGPAYTPYTVVLKKLKRQPTDKVTLYDTGAFYKSIFVNVFADQFEIDATDAKTEELTAKYGEVIFGLTDASMSQLITHLKPLILDKLRKALK